ncbi:WD40-repeat-containing domain protein [Blastocladiella britannica]|nr:WD40-repeat-containing domain protein [Blastocladiella britannica]
MKDDDDDHNNFGLARFLAARAIGATAHPSRPISRTLHDLHLARLTLSRTNAMATHHQAACVCLALEHTDHRYLLSSGLDRRIALWDTRPRVDDISARMSISGRIRPIAEVAAGAGHRHAVTAVAWFPSDSGMFFTGSVDETVRVWDTNEMAHVSEFKLQSRVAALSASPTALVAVATEDHHVRLCDVRTGSAAQVLRGHTRSVTAVAWVPCDDHLLVSGSADGTIRMFDARQARSHLATLTTDPTASETSTATARVPVITGLAVAPGGTYAVAHLNHGRVQVWDLHECVMTASTRTAHAGSRATIPALTHQSPRQHTRPYCLVPSGRHVLAFDLRDQAADLRSIAVAGPDEMPSTGASRVLEPEGMAPVTQVVWSARRGVAWSAAEDGSITAWEAGGASSSATTEDIVVRPAGIIATQSSQEGGAIKRPVPDDWSDDE